MSSTVIEFNASYSIFTSVFANMNLNLVAAMAANITDAGNNTNDSA